MPVVEKSALLGVVSISLGMVLSPGPNMMYLVSRSIGQGRRAGIVSLCGVVAGFLVYLVGANLGLAVLFAAFPEILTAIRLVGAVYLLWLAWETVKPGGVSVFTVRDVPDDPPRRLFAMGLTTNLLNPKIAILYVSVIPQFVDLDKGNLLLQGIVLGGFQIVVATSVNLSIVLAAGGVAGFLARRPAWLRAQRVVMGGMLGALAVTLAFDHGGGAARITGRAGAGSCQRGGEVVRCLPGPITATKPADRVMPGARPGAASSPIHRPPRPVPGRPGGSVTPTQQEEAGCGA